MAGNCPAVVEPGGYPSMERTQSTTLEDSATMTIEFLRARLLSERAASRTARQQAQQIAKKVLELQSRLDLEVDLRKKAEVAADKVFAALKLKGLSTERFVTGVCKPLQTEKSDTEEGFLSPDDSKEIDPEQQLCDEICCCIDDQEAAGLDFKMLAAGSQIGCKTVLNGQSAFEDVDAEPCNREERKVYLAKNSMDLDMHGEDKPCDVQTSLRNEIEIKEGENTPETLKKMDGILDESAGCSDRQVLAQNLTGPLQQVEVEEDTLSKRQPQKLEQQGQMDDTVSTLEGKELSYLQDLNSGNVIHSNASPPMHPGPEYNTATSNDFNNQRDVDKTSNESENCKHAEGLMQLVGNVSSELNELAQREADGRQTLSQSVKGNFMNSSEIGMRSLDSPMYSEVEQHKTLMSPPHPPCLGPCQVTRAQHNCTGTQLSSAETWSPRDMGDSSKSGFENGRPDSEGPTEHPHVSITEFHTHGSVMDDRVCDTTDTNVNIQRSQEMHSAGTNFVGLTNKDFEMGHAYPASLAYGQGDIASQNHEGFRFNMLARHTRAPVNDNAHAPIYDENARVGDILTALHLAKLHVKGDEQLLCQPEDRLRPSTPTSGRGNPYTCYFGDEFRQLQNNEHSWWSDAPHRPPVQFLSGPSSDHEFPALERHDGLVRSNSGSPVPALEADIQPSGKVHLGNGIILYTD